MATQEQIDRARGWASEHYHRLGGAEYEATFNACLEDIIAIDEE